MQKPTRPRSPQGAHGADDPGHHHRCLGARRLRLDGQQDRRPGRGWQRPTTRTRSRSATARGSMGGFRRRRCRSGPRTVRDRRRRRRVVPAVMLLMDDQCQRDHGRAGHDRGRVAGADEGRETFSSTTPQGRALTAEDEGDDVAVLGSDIARKYDKQVGDTIALQAAFRSSGVLEPTLTAPDQAAMVPWPPPSASSSPPCRRCSGGLDAGELATTMRRVPRGRRHRGAGGSHRGAGPRRGGHDRRGLRPQIGSATSILNAILIGVALISLARRRPVGHQHDGHVDRRADPRDRHQARHRRRDARASSESWSPNRRSSA